MKRVGGMVSSCRTLRPSLSSNALNVVIGSSSTSVGRSILLLQLELCKVLPILDCCLCVCCCTCTVPSLYCDTL